MHDKLIGYLLGALEVEEVTHVEQLLEADDVRQQLELLRRSLAPLEADRSAAEVPPQLAIRTCQRIRVLRASAT